MKSKGFTLIELLVVVAIISLLSSVVLASLGEARERARVTKFKQELSQFVNAVELYRSDHGGDLPGYIPDFSMIQIMVQSDGFVSSESYYDSYTSSGGAFHNDLLPYIPSLPVPLSNDWYYYIEPTNLRCFGETDPYDYLILIHSSNPGFEDWPGYEVGANGLEVPTYKCQSF